ncbi:hypothetical protein [Actinomadura rugatobispora]|uniref:Uncharacterized protein n=1 Tax=Actinomadura rugatobispora TaxID=1994 RepID=A0ABW0ZW05_9ACTN|nr:hypothetical protein GCM10010200_051050 [Actinomadura rugatobispora]
MTTTLGEYVQLEQEQLAPATVGRVEAAPAQFIGFADFTAQGKFIKPLTTPPGIVGPGSQVMVSITEIDGSNTPFMGNAFMQVFNIVPQSNLIRVACQLFWGDPLRVRLNVVIF